MPHTLRKEPYAVPVIIFSNRSSLTYLALQYVLFREDLLQHMWTRRKTPHPALPFRPQWSPAPVLRRLEYQARVDPIRGGMCILRRTERQVKQYNNWENMVAESIRHIKISAKRLSILGSVSRSLGIQRSKIIWVACSSRLKQSNFFSARLSLPFLCKFILITEYSALLHSSLWWAGHDWCRLHVIFSGCVFMSIW